MLNAFNVRWLESDETKIKFTKEFESAYYVLKIDILQDAIGLLEKEKHELMKDERKRWKERIEGRKNATV